MKSHGQIDLRSLALARAIVETIDRDPERMGLETATQVCQRWYRESPNPAVAEWLGILERGWEQVRSVLLDPGEEGIRLRQSNPFCGILTPTERWRIYRQFDGEQGAA
jgi:hypothetical protein